MTPHQLLRNEHDGLRGLAQAIRKALSSDRPRAAELVSEFHKTIQAHFKKENAFYSRIDGGKRITDRALMHTLRNDHAAVLFTLESLAIKLRKGGPSPEWEARLNSMFDVLLPHLENEEKHLLPEADHLSATDQAALLAEMQSNA